MKTSFLAVALAAAVGVVGCNKSADRVDADDTKKNERDKNTQTKTPVDQGENKADLEITKEIRKDVVGKDGLSQSAKNVKIVTKDGVVTLRGPVKSEDEKSTIVSVAEKAPGVKRVDNELEVKQD
jgi:hyperosmotically inducible protein